VSLGLFFSLTFTDFETHFLFKMTDRSVLYEFRKYLSCEFNNTFPTPQYKLVMEGNRPPPPLRNQICLAFVLLLFLSHGAAALSSRSPKRFRLISDDVYLEQLSPVTVPINLPSRLSRLTSLCLMRASPKHFS